MNALDRLITSYWYYSDKLYSLADERLDGYPLMYSFWPSVLICVLYIILIKVGKRVMQDRKPWNIRGLMVSYNVALVILSVYLVIEMNYCLFMKGIGLGCVEVDYSRTPLTMRMVQVGWLFYITKIIEMLDTFFFILRKKYNLITFLHVFHHASQPISLWFGIKYVPGGFGALFPMVNSFVHVFMYTYYGLAAAGPQYQKYLWWKRYVTVLQMAQFVFLILHNGQLFFIECNYPRVFSTAIFTYACIFLVLFLNYFVHDIMRERRAASRAKMTSLKEANGASNGHSTHITNGNHTHGNGYAVNSHHANGNGVMANGNGVMANGNGVMANGNGKKHQ